MISDFADWRKTARALLAAGVPPGEIDLADAHHGQPGLLQTPMPERTAKTHNVPKEFLALAETAAQFRDPQRWNLL